MANIYARAMTREEFKDAYQNARIYGRDTIEHLHPSDPVRIVLLARKLGFDRLEYRQHHSKSRRGGYRPYVAAIDRYRITKKYAKGTCRPANYRVERSGFVQLVDREMTIGRCSMEAVNG